MDADALKDLAPGNHVVIKGTKTHWKKETQKRKKTHLPLWAI